MLERSLVTIQRIKAISPIEGADKIELAHILGWQCVVKKGEYAVGDLCAYCEIDSFLPIRPEFEFLRSSSYKKNEIVGEGFRIKTAKIRGEISQGLVISMETLREMGIDTTTLNEGDDITEVLGVKKFEMPEMATGQGTTIGGLGLDVPKTDEKRVQVYGEKVIPEFAGIEYYISTKVDGSSHSIAIDREGIFHVYGHNYEYYDDGKSSFYEYVKKHNFEQKLREYLEVKQVKSITVQGEWAGPGIQQNKLKLKCGEWFVFTLLYNGERQSLWDMLNVSDYIGAKHVPIEEIGRNLPEKYPDVDALLKRAEGNYENAGAKEGIVIRPVEPVYSKKLQNWLSLKAINNRYLLKDK